MKKTDMIFERRSIRSYTGEPVSQEDLRLILKAGMAAPSARNSRPWEFIVIQNRAKEKGKTRSRSRCDIDFFMQGN
mgnify:CR=1 FL=1